MKIFVVKPNDLYDPSFFIKSRINKYPTGSSDKYVDGILNQIEKKVFGD